MSSDSFFPDLRLFSFGTETMILTEAFATTLTYVTPVLQSSEEFI